MYQISNNYQRTTLSDAPVASDFAPHDAGVDFTDPNKWGINRQDRWGPGEIDTSLVAIGEVSYEFCRVKNYMPKLDNGVFVV